MVFPQVHLVWIGCCGCLCWFHGASLEQKTRQILSERQRMCLCTMSSFVVLQKTQKPKSARVLSHPTYIYITFSDNPSISSPSICFSLLFLVSSEFLFFCLFQILFSQRTTTDLVLQQAGCRVNFGLCVDIITGQEKEEPSSSNLSSSLL